MTQEEKLRLEELMAELKSYKSKNTYEIMGEEKLAELLELLLKSQATTQA